MKLKIGEKEIAIKDYFQSINMDEVSVDNLNITVAKNESKTIEELAQILQDDFKGEFIIEKADGTQNTFTNFVASNVTKNEDDTSSRLSINFVNEA